MDLHYHQGVGPVHDVTNAAVTSMPIYYILQSCFTMETLNYKSWGLMNSDQIAWNGAWRLRCTRLLTVE